MPASCSPTRHMPITDICFEIGYANVSNFNRNFLSQPRHDALRLPAHVEAAADPAAKRQRCSTDTVVQLDTA